LRATLKGLKEIEGGQSMSLLPWGTCQLKDAVAFLMKPWNSTCSERHQDHHQKYLDVKVQTSGPNVPEDEDELDIDESKSELRAHAWSITSLPTRREGR
jgi:hypothetical protein